MKKLAINQFVQRYQEIDGSRGAEDSDYKSHVAWDSPILCLFREYPTHTSFAEVRCKVGYVNRLYKCILGGEKDLLSWKLDDLESRVAKAFIDQNVDAIMAELGGLLEFSNATLRDIVRRHTGLVGIVASVTARKEEVFCSKYASFHFPEIVPTLDSKAEGMAKQLVNELSRANISVKEDSCQQDENDLERYENHCANLLMLIDVLRRNGIARPSLKKIDHVLYWE